MAGLKGEVIDTDPARAMHGLGVRYQEAKTGPDCVGRNTQIDQRIETCV